MCVLFIYLNDDDHECPYRLVVANNRDEYWGRPTATAEFRGDDQQWIGGLLLLIWKKSESENNGPAFITPDRRQLKTLILSTNVDQNSLETEFSIAICQPTGDKWQW